MSYTRASIRRMQGYQYGEQPKETGIIKLNTNENPYPPSPAVSAALQKFDVATLRLYPDARCSDFCRMAAELHGLMPEQVMATNGGDELLRLAVNTFVAPGAAVGTTEPSYSLYRVLAAVQAASFITIPLGADYGLPKDAAAQLNAAQVQLTCLVNPHAPSGKLTEVGRLRQLATELQGVLLIDEAYADFISPARQYDSIALLKDHDNVLILRSLSKGYSLAGLRFGYALGSANLIQPMLHKTKDSYNLDAIAQALACAAIADQSYAASRWQQVRAQRQRLAEELTARGWHVVESQANFLLAANAKGDADTELVFTRLKAAGILVRYFKEPRLARCLRISVGSEADNNRLLQALDEITAAGA